MGLYEMMLDEDDEETLMLIACAVAMEAEGSSSRRRRRAPGAPPRALVERNREEGDAIIRAQYFGPNPVYDAETFRRRFRMPKPVFITIHDALLSRYEYFRQMPDATGRYGLSGLQKCVGSVRMLAYGQPSDILDDYIRAAESTLREAVHMFCKGVIEIFGPKYLRSPTPSDIQRILAFNEARGFPGMLGSIDCMHWRWKNCPAAYKAVYTGRGKHPTMILEAVATHDLWIWHAYFGLPGSLNDINVLHRSTVFHNFLHGAAPNVNFTVNGNTYDMGYYLADGIYPEWPAFVKSLGQVHDERSQKFKEMQEAARKEIERTFGVLQSRWGVIRGPAYGWDPEVLSDMLTACIIMHNMIIEYEGREVAVQNVFNPGNIPFVNQEDLTQSPQRSEFVQTRHSMTMNSSNNSEFVRRRQRLTNRGKHKQLEKDLIQHMWNHIGSMAHQGAA